MRDAAGVVRGEIDDDLVIHVEPLGMMVHFLDGDGGGGHKAEGVYEVGELIFVVEFFIDHGPAGERGQGGIKLLSGELVHETIVERKAAAVTLFGEMAFEFAGIMENSEDIDHGVAAPPVDHKMSRFSDNTGRAADAATAEEEMVCAKAWPKLQPLSRTRAVRVGRDVMDRLPEEAVVAERSPFAESRPAPLQRLANVASRGRRKNDAQ